MIFDPKHKILSYREAGIKAAELKDGKEKIIMMSGSFDLPHITHVGFFNNVKKSGGKLFIALGTDEQIRTLKGPTRPVIPEHARASMLAALEIVDYVIIANEPMEMPSKIHFDKLASIIKPDVFALNDDDSAVEEKRAFAKKHGAEFVIIDRFIMPFDDSKPEYQINTSNIIKKILANPN